MLSPSMATEWYHTDHALANGKQLPGHWGDKGVRMIFQEVARKMLENVVSAQKIILTRMALPLFLGPQRGWGTA
jgi:hypothetical protein